MKLISCALPASLVAAVCIVIAPPASRAVILLQQNFDNTPVNYTLPFGPPALNVFQASDPTRYFALSNTPGMSLNPGVTGNATTYLAVQNIDGDGDGTLTFNTGAPPALDFQVFVGSLTSFTLDISLAGMPAAEPENYIRAFQDVDGDGFYEAQIFNFLGSANSPYIDSVLGPLSGAFADFKDIPLTRPTTPDNTMRIRLEAFTDTQSQNEAQGIDNIVINGVPEPTTGGLLLVAGILGLARRRRVV